MILLSTAYPILNQPKGLKEFQKKGAIKILSAYSNNQAKYVFNLKIQSETVSFYSQET